MVLSGRMGWCPAGGSRCSKRERRRLCPPGTPHTFWNASRGGEVLHHTVELRPALRSEGFFETVFSLRRDGKLIAGKVPSPLMMAPVVVEYENWLAGPPVILQKLLFPPLALLGRLLGYRTSYPQYSATPKNTKREEEPR